MVRSVTHPQTRELHRAHVKRYRRAWIIIAGIIGAALILWAFGYFGDVMWPELEDAILRTTYRVALAYGIALALGSSIALIIGWSPFSEILFPIFDILQNIPSFALIPIFIYFLGYSDLMIILFSVSSIVWPILFAVLTAIKSAHADMNDAATVFGARGFKRIRYYLAPLSFPAILTGSIVGIAMGWETVIGAEIIANMAGFGAFVKAAGSSGISQSTIAGMLAILIIVFAINRIVWAPLLTESAKRYV